MRTATFRIRTRSCTLLVMRAGFLSPILAGVRERGFGRFRTAARHLAFTPLSACRPRRRPRSPRRPGPQGCAVRLRCVPAARAGFPPAEQVLELDCFTTACRRRQHTCLRAVCARRSQCCVLLRGHKPAATSLGLPGSQTCVSEQATRATRATTAPTAATARTARPAATARMVRSSSSPWRCTCRSSARTQPGAMHCFDCISRTPLQTLQLPVIGRACAAPKSDAMRYLQVPRATRVRSITLRQQITPCLLAHLAQ